MLPTRMILGFALLASTAAVAEARPRGPTLQDRRQAACYSDVQRLCGQFIPDVGKVTACMKPMKARVGAKCRALWDDEG